jgi:hypothetical protein
MIPFRSFRSHPYFAPLFAEVHPLCWPILWWSLNRFLKWYGTSGYSDILFHATRWGFIRIAYLGDRLPDPSAYRPYVRARPRFDDLVWESAVPVMLRTLSFEAVRPDATFILPLLRGRCPGGAEGAFSLPNTS